MRHLFSLGCFALAIAVCGHATAAAADEALPTTQHHQLGLLGAITEERWKGGLVFEREHFEVQLLAHASFENGGNRELDIDLKVGGRLDLGTRNWLALGLEFDSFGGSRQAGHSLSGSFATGPYLSIERYFADTPVMLCLWVNPIRYDRAKVSGLPGYPQHDVRIFQTGGFGIAYLFL
jgi:hypothetical protein